jgi:hypothetical protein
LQERQVDIEKQRKNFFDFFFLFAILLIVYFSNKFMDRNNLIELTGDIYRLTLFFPKKEPLRYKTREVAVDILANPTRKNLDVLDSFLDIALAQNWVSPSDILALKEKYAILEKDLEERREKIRVADNPVKLEYISQDEEPINNGNNFDRKGTIMDFLKENGKAQVWQLKEILPDVSKRTLRRDFERMLEEGMIERIGEKNETFYKIKNI